MKKFFVFIKEFVLTGKGVLVSKVNLIINFNYFSVDFLKKFGKYWILCKHWENKLKALEIQPIKTVEPPVCITKLDKLIHLKVIATTADFFKWHTDKF